MLRQRALRLRGEQVHRKPGTAGHRQQQPGAGQDLDLSGRHDQVPQSLKTVSTAAEEVPSLLVAASRSEPNAVIW
ncbi:hypothetical protein D3C71_851720 [compost metagenome]